MVKIGNDAGMKIKHIGSASFALAHMNTQVILNNLLHVPEINKNIISVSKFAKDNHVYFEFFPDKCYVKNQDTNQILLQGKIKDGLYVFLALQSSISYSVNTTSVDPDKNVLHL